MNHESVIHQVGFSALVALFVLLWIGVCAAAWWLGRTVKKYRR